MGLAESGQSLGFRMKVTGPRSNDEGAEIHAAGELVSRCSEPGLGMGDAAGH